MKQPIGQWRTCRPSRIAFRLHESVQNPLMELRADRQTPVELAQMKPDASLYFLMPLHRSIRTASIRLYTYLIYIQNPIGLLWNELAPDTTACITLLGRGHLCFTPEEWDVYRPSH